MKFPDRGGSYIRNKDGSLTPVSEASKPVEKVEEPKKPEPFFKPSLTESDNG